MAKMDLEYGAFSIVIEGYAGDGSRGDIAIDEPTIYNRQCSRVNEEVWEASVFPLLELILEETNGVYPDAVGHAPGYGEYTVKEWVCYRGMMKEDDMDGDNMGDRSMEDMGSGSMDSMGGDSSMESMGGYSMDSTEGRDSMQTSGEQKCSQGGGGSMMDVMEAMMWMMNPWMMQYKQLMQKQCLMQQHQKNEHDMYEAKKYLEHKLNMCMEPWPKSLECYDKDLTGLFSSCYFSTLKSVLIRPECVLCSSPPI